jgi:hypothetical protein
MAQVCHCRRAEGALRSLHDQLVVTQPLRDCPNVLQAFAPQSAVDKDVVKEHQHELPSEILQHLIHQCLKCRRHIREPERHHKEFEVAMVGLEHRLLNVVSGHAHLVVAAPKVQLSEEFGAAKFIEQLIDDRDWEHVADGLRVQLTVIHVELP